MKWILVCEQNPNSLPILSDPLWLSHGSLFPWKWMLPYCSCGVQVGLDSPGRVSSSVSPSQTLTSTTIRWVVTAVIQLKSMVKTISCPLKLFVNTAQITNELFYLHLAWPFMPYHPAGCSNLKQTAFKSQFVLCTPPVAPLPMLLSPLTVFTVNKKQQTSLKSACFTTRARYDACLHTLLCHCWQQTF